MFYVFNSSNFKCIEEAGLVEGDPDVWGFLVGRILGKNHRDIDSFKWGRSFTTVLSKQD